MGGRQLLTVQAVLYCQLLPGSDVDTHWQQPLSLELFHVLYLLATRLPSLSQTHHGLLHIPRPPSLTLER